jgi:hypothetical protein
MKQILVGTQTCEILEFSRADGDVITKTEGKTLSELNLKVSHHVSISLIGLKYYTLTIHTIIFDVHKFCFFICLFVYLLNILNIHKSI